MQTKIIGGGTVVPGPELGVDPAFNAGRFSIRPIDHTLSGQVLGHYRVSGTTTAAAPAANSILLNFRWGDASRFCVIQRVSAGVQFVTAITTQQRLDPLVMTVQRSYTVSETTNASALTPSRARANMATSLVSQVAVASAAAGISGGTRTPDASPVSSLSIPIPLQTAIGAGVINDDFIRYDQLMMHPLTLSPNEGFTIAWGGTALASGTLEVNFTLSWSEVVTF